MFLCHCSCPPCHCSCPPWFPWQKCKRVDLCGFGLSEKHGVRHHYFNRNTTVKGVERGVDGLDKEFDSLLDLRGRRDSSGWRTPALTVSRSRAVQYWTVLYCSALHCFDCSSNLLPRRRHCSLSAPRPLLPRSNARLAQLPAGPTPGWL